MAYIMDYSVFLKEKPKAYNYANGGVEIYKIDYGIDDYVYAKSNVLGDRPHFHHVKITYTPSGRAYIRIFGIVMYLDTFIKCNSPWCA